MNKTLEGQFKKVEDEEVKRALTGDESTLPPPGDKRDEILKMRSDALEEQAEKTAEEQGTFAINPKAFEPVREARQGMQKAANVSNKDPNYEYLWVWMGQHGFMIRALQIKGWQVVQGEDKAGEEFKTESTTRRFIDTILMKIKKDKLEDVKKLNREITERMNNSVTSEMERLNDKYSKYGVRSKTSLKDVEAIHSHGNRVSIPAEAMRAIAKEQIGEMLKTGNIPGWEVNK